MFKGLLVLAMAAAACLAASVTFNDYRSPDASGDRSDKNMLTRKAIGGMLRCRDAGVPGQEYNHFFGPGQFSYDDRRKLGYYWNPGIQEFGELNSSANVTAAYIWGHCYISAGQTGILRAEAAAMKMALDTTEDLEPTWNMDGIMVGADNYATLPFVSDRDTGRYTGYTGDPVWQFDSVQQAIVGQKAFNVTKAVKYIMDHNTESDLGIIVRSDSGEAQLSIAAEELNSTGTDYRLLLTIIYNGTPNLAVENTRQISSSLALHQNSPNPCRAGTTIAFNVPGTQKIRLSVFTIDGALVKTLVNGTANGASQVIWDNSDAEGSKVRSGVYLYRLESQGKTITRKMVVVQ